MTIKLKPTAMKGVLMVLKFRMLATLKIRLTVYIDVIDDGQRIERLRPLLVSKTEVVVAWCRL